MCVGATETLDPSEFVGHVLAELQILHRETACGRHAGDSRVILASLLRLEEDCERTRRGVKNDRDRWTERAVSVLIQTETDFPAARPEPAAGEQTRVMPEE